MELAGVAEIARLANVSRQTVFNWIARNRDFPVPIATLACGQIWERRAVERWLEASRKIPQGGGAQMEFSEDRVYTFDELKQSFGGDMQTYLPQVGSRIVCGCFNLAYNPNAPSEVLVGRGPKIELKAQKLMEQGGTIPVFLKHATNHWRYAGRWRPVSLETSPALIAAKRAAAQVVHPVTAVLRLKRDER